MPFIKSLNYSNIIAYTYKLSIGDSLIIHQNNHNTYFILEGISVITKVFTNQEKFSTYIANNKQILYTPFSKHTSNYFYQIEAISTVYILSFKSNKVELFKNLIDYQYDKILVSYYYMIELLIHKNIRQRLIHLLINLSEILGEYKKTYIVLNLSLSYNIIGSIIGANKNTISKLIKELETYQLITYRKTQIIIHDLVTLSKYKKNNKK
uniref:Global nitrogen transcriptional regulator n=1 Tax=Galaxaura rugosa TaxID=268570 RepID=A0A1G4NTG8_9FLOR|nr:Global nitrogen transcriptional regulator [Galaxaura rugosa]SCW21846.1 Global nitrogen transcriptional regulator [Galaxaura rugosa]